MTRTIILALMALACADPPIDGVSSQDAAVPFCTRSTQCEAGYACSGGECLDPSGRNQAEDHLCEDVGDPDHDLYHCGSCGHRCPWGTDGIVSCVDGVCSSAAGVPNG